MAAHCNVLIDIVIAFLWVFFVYICTCIIYYRVLEFMCETWSTACACIAPTGSGCNTHDGTSFMSRCNVRMTILSENK